MKYTENNIYDTSEMSSHKKTKKTPEHVSSGVKKTSAQWDYLATTNSALLFFDQAASSLP